LTSTIGEILPAAARRFGTRPALIVGDRSFSFEELQAFSDRVAHGLVAAGVEPGDRVALYGPNCWEWLVAYYGIAKTGERGSLRGRSRPAGPVATHCDPDLYSNPKQ